MPIEMINTVPGMPVEAYDDVMSNTSEAMRSAPGFVSHTAEVTPDAITVTEVWDSREQWQDWYDTSVRPHLPPDAPDPDVTELHNVNAR